VKFPLYTKARLLLHLEKDPCLRFFYSLLGFVPKNITLYKQALRHRSNQIEPYRGGAGYNNERLEFLGDAILDAIVSDAVYQYFPDKKEGFLSNTRSKIVQRETMNKIALEMGIDRFVSVNRNVLILGSNIYGNALEAVIGAIYLDRGYKKAARFVNKKLLKSYIDLSVLAKEEINFKSHLIEWGQKEKIGISFSSSNIAQPINRIPEFKTEVIIGVRVVGIGIGGTKKESQQRAAEVALEEIKKDKELKLYISRLGTHSANGFSTDEESTDS